MNAARVFQTTLRTRCGGSSPGCAVDRPRPRWPAWTASASWRRRSATPPAKWPSSAGTHTPTWWTSSALRTGEWVCLWVNMLWCLWAGVFIPHHVALRDLNTCVCVCLVSSDSGEYYCVATPWYLSASTGAWTQAGELTSSRVFLTVQFAGEEQACSSHHGNTNTIKTLKMLNCISVCFFFSVGLSTVTSSIRCIGLNRFVTLPLFDFYLAMLKTVRKISSCIRPFLRIHARI